MENRMCIAYNKVNDRARIDTDENTVYLNFAPLVRQDQVSVSESAVSQQLNISIYLCMHHTRHTYLRLKFLLVICVRSALFRAFVFDIVFWPSDRHVKIVTIGGNAM